MRINILAKTTFAILAVLALVAVVSYVSSGDTQLLAIAKTVTLALIFGSVAIALLVHSPRLIKALR